MGKSSLEDFFDVGNSEVAYQHEAWPFENMTMHERIPLLTISTNVHGVTIEADVEITPLRLCARTPVRVHLTFSDQNDVSAVRKRLVDGEDGFGIGLRMHMIGITNSSNPGNACGDTTSPDCDRISREVLLYEDRNSSEESGPSSESDSFRLDFVGLFVADPSSEHYQFVLELDKMMFGSGWIEPLPYHASWTPEVHDITLLLRVRANDFPDDVCFGFLQWCDPGACIARKWLPIQRAFV